MAPQEPSSSQPPAASPLPAPTSQAPPPSDPTKYYGTPYVLHNAAVVVSILGPLGLLLPGRSRGAWNVQNIILGGGSCWALNQLAHDYTGKSVVTRSSERWMGILKKVSTVLDPLPTDKARVNAQLIEAERIRQEVGMDEKSRKVAEAARRERALTERGIVARLWMGSEEEGWKEKRIEEERKMLESGKGYWDMISDQISEVWNGKKKDGEGEGEGKKGEGETEGKK